MGLNLKTTVTFESCSVIVLLSRLVLTLGKVADDGFNHNTYTCCWFVRTKVEGRQD